MTINDQEKLSLLLLLLLLLSLSLFLLFLFLLLTSLSPLVLQVVKGFSGAYDANSYDSNSIIGGHPAFTNLYMATAFSGHGTMQSAAAARGLSELILFGGYRTLDLSRFGFERCMAVQEHSIESELNFC